MLDHTSTRFEQALDPVDLVFDTVGGELLERSPAVVRQGGRLVSIAEEPPQIPREVTGKRGKVVLRVVGDEVAGV